MARWRAVLPPGSRETSNFSGGARNSLTSLGLGVVTGEGGGGVGDSGRSGCVIPLPVVHGERVGRGNGRCDQTGADTHRYAYTYPHIQHYHGLDLNPFIGRNSNSYVSSCLSIKTTALTIASAP